MMTARPLIPALLLILFLSACETAPEDACETLMLDVAACAGGDPADFQSLCNLEPSEAARIADAACATNGKSDGESVSNDEGESCFNFDFECSDNLICRPLDEDEDDHACLPQGGWNDFCDDDSDCAGGVACMGQNGGAGRCKDYLPPGGRCGRFDWQCEGDHVCRPADEFNLDHFCLPQGHRYALCDNDSDCAYDLVCTYRVGATGNCLPE